MSSKSEIEILKEKISELEKKLSWYQTFTNEILQTPNVIVVELDTEGKVILVNKAVEKITGYTKEEIIGKNWFETLVPKNKYPQVWKIFEEFQQKNEIVEIFENPILTKEGKERYISWRNSVLKQDDKIIGTLSFGIDITENLHILDQFITYQMSYKTLIENLPGVIYKCKNDPNHTMEEISSKCFELTGYNSDDFIKKTINFSELILDEDSEKVQLQIDEAIKQNKPFQLTYRIRTKDGKIKWVWEQGAVIRGEKEEDNYLEGYIFDITEKVKAEEQLEIQREFFKQLFENSPIAIVILDRNDRIIDINKAFEDLFFFKRDEVKNLTLNQLIVPPDRKSEGLALSNKVLSDEIIITETKRMRKDGSLIDVLVIGYPILHKGERIGIFGLYKDITDQKMMYELLREEKEKIEELNNLKSSFLLNISHEIRTPLNSILGFSELLISELNELNFPELTEFARSIKRGGMRLLNLMDNIIEISLIESSKSELSFEKININLIIDPIINSFITQAKEKNLFLDKIYEDDFSLLTDPKRLTLVLNNLIDNAIKFTEKGGVRVKTYIKEDVDKIKYGVIEVIDTGIGISEKFKEKLFESFTQASTGLDRKYEGIGIGLYLSKKLIELLGGKIEIVSEVDKGTIVRIYLPIE
ncbi:MAG: PAS domain S-box protein [Ignavibacteria bacterium]